MNKKKRKKFPSVNDVHIPLIRIMAQTFASIALVYRRDLNKTFGRGGGKTGMRHCHAKELAEPPWPQGKEELVGTEPLYEA